MWNVGFISNFLGVVDKNADQNFMFLGIDFQTVENNLIKVGIFT